MNEEKELHEMIIGIWWRDWLEEKDVCAADVVFHVDVDLTIGKLANLTWFQLYAKVLCDVLSKWAVRCACDEAEPSLRCLLLLLHGSDRNEEKKKRHAQQVTQAPSLVSVARPHMQDRLSEIRRGRPPAPDLEAGAASPGPPGAPTTDFLKEFYQEVDVIKAKLSEIEGAIRTIDEKYNDTLTAASTGKADAATQELERHITDTNRTAQDVAARLKAMQADNAKHRGASAEARIRESIHSTLAKRFYELMGQYQALKSKNAARYREKVRRQVEVASGTKPTEQQLDEIIEAGDPNRLFATKLLQDKRSTDAANALVFMKDRHNDIVRLEKSINELHQIFVDMAILVEQQGEMLDVIEKSVEKSMAYTEDAVQELRKVNKSTKRSRKKKCIIAIIVLCCCLIVFLAIFLPLYLKLA